MKLSTVFLSAVVGAAALIGAPHLASAGCSINVKAKYATKVEGSAATAQLQVVTPASEVRVKGGFWGKPFVDDGTPLTLTHGNAGTKALDLDLGCSAQRQYRFRIELREKQASGAWKVTQSAWLTFPGGEEWTTATTIDLGDIGKAL
jgi:hypothetical protein